jgi:hypothetical protein
MFSLAIIENPPELPKESRPLKEPKRAKEPMHTKPSPKPKPSTGKQRSRKGKHHTAVDPVPVALMAGMADRLMEATLS